MDEYREKLAKLPLDRLKDLAKAYEKTIHYHQVTLRDATIVGMTKVIDYNQVELDKKTSELAEIQKLIQEREIK